MESARNVLNFLVTLLEVILIFNLLIVVHETGHFLAARWRGLVIEKFGIWFGKPLWKKTINGVQYSLGSLPFGGFVALPQLAPMESIEGKLEGAPPRAALPPTSPLDKIIVAFAGPLFSFGLAFLFAVIVWVVGRPVSEGESTRTIGYVTPDSPAAQAGLQAGDVITEIDGHAVKRFGGMNESVVWFITRSEGQNIHVDVLRDGQPKEFEVAAPKPEKNHWWQREDTRHIGIEPQSTPIVAQVKPGSPAATAGLRPLDQVVKLNGTPTLSLDAFVVAEGANYNQPLTLSVVRGGQPLALTIPAMPFKISEVTKDGPAANAGLKAGDVVQSINGKPANRFEDLQDAVKASKGTPITLTYLPDGKGEVKTVSITPQQPEGLDRWLVGLSRSFDADGIGWDEKGPSRISHETPGSQIQSSVSSIVNTLGAVISPKSDVKVQHLGGPVMILRSYYIIFFEEGWRLALWFSVVLNVNLALLNLLPFPVLDGGHITLALIEAVRRKPVNIRLLEFLQTGCAKLLIGYMLYITFYDVGDLARGRGQDVKFKHAEQSR